MNTLPTIAKLPGAAGELETFAMANCLMILSNQRNAAIAGGGCGGASGEEEEIGRTYPCKTCGRKFPSFQALGGHRASHKKIKPVSDDLNSSDVILAKPKVHACSICGVEFPIGQALGGHMRRHRGLLGGGDGGGVSVGGGGGSMAVSSSVTTEGSIGNSDGNNNSEKKRKTINDYNEVVVPILKKSSSSKRVCLDLDLSLRLWRKQDEEQTIVNGVEEGEIVEQDRSVKNDLDDFLKLELRCY